MTMKKLALLPLLFAALGSLTAYAEETRYVSDDLSTYVHSGPSARYRIAGSLNSGEKVTVINVNNETGFVQVRDSKNRDVWLPKEMLSATPSLKERVPAMEDEIKTLRGKLANIDGTWNDKTADIQNRVAASDDIIDNLKKENDSLRNQVVVAKKKLDAISVQLDDKQRDIILQWFMYGGGVAGVGLLLGLLLPHMVPRRKKKDRWMN
ncbi:SH3 domain-containing protein [Morganella psychrotolerans]|uniref:SH3 domain-containing protein n=2 Tax=Morganella psychrotolerans TaxID=368603 RepID=A0A5M9R3F8_9GAMM|nr:SH3 domain-containing protein [Morganella psychrotolerans]